MKARNQNHLRKWCALGLVVFGFVLSPVISAEMTEVSSGDYFAVQRTTTPRRADASVYDLLIIAPCDFMKSLRPLVVHKDNVGIRTRLVPLCDVYRQMYWQGRDKPEKIKYFIKAAKENWGIKYVMLVGDFELMPVRYVYNADNNTEWNEPRFISDLYYADLYDAHGNFSSWDTNGNGIYGEWYGEAAKDPNIDLYPDVYVGRLACTNEAEVRAMVHKIITYETTAYGQEWFHRFVVAAGDTYPVSENPNWTTYEGEVNTQDAIDNMSGFTPVKLWTSDGTLTGPKDVIHAIDQGCGFLYFSG
ncbi:MAG TPA: C25 family cysteine peptidase, partial [Candidatus Thermoplasmatota archaeon]|nr:C25 family cysteine peptidase [Candidatus Thermoplasmatota archaeon]